MALTLHNVPGLRDCVAIHKMTAFLIVMPAKAGIQRSKRLAILDSGLRRNDIMIELIL